MSVSINDGQTETLKLTGTPNLYPDLTIKVRRLTSDEYAAQLDATAGQNEVKVGRLNAALMARRIKWWNYATSDKIIPVSAAAIIGMNRILAARLWRVVAGLDAPDEVIGDAEEAEAQTLDLLEASQTGRAIGDVTHARQLGN